MKVKEKAAYYFQIMAAW